MSLDILIMISIFILFVVIAMWWQYVVRWDAERLRSEWAKLKHFPPYI